ncbi:hypothetical protein KIK84_00235 [Curvibacter sp. CHRR-16]|uniref:hypothetical protein n=1 Tax=Curvibacter sp. CHRR-16 TaxID=2835872 RepID=UPI001BDA42B5|nr:hypothetical protein [Curvibacter sp. CHRR-16]MBT0568739.1 hypothetical protein [Curvibacter sp. CHRR-16]
MKQALPQRLVKPRNPFVAAALQRKAGSHTKPHKSQRQHDKVQLKKLQGHDPFQSAWINSHNDKTAFAPCAL